MFSKASSSSDLLSDGNLPSLVINGPPYFLSSYNVAALRTDGYLNGISELINTALQSLARARRK